MNTSIDLHDFVSGIRDIVLPAPFIEGISGSVITREDLERGLTLVIPPFDGMRPGDQFLAQLEGWDRAVGVLSTVAENGEARAFFTPQQALTLAGQEVAALYAWVGRPDLSPSTFYDVALRLWPAVIEQAQVNRLPSGAVYGPLTVTVSPWVGIEAGDVCSVYLYGRGAAGVWASHHVITPQEAGQDLTLDLTAGLLVAHQFGWVHLCYSVVALGVETWGPQTTYWVDSDIAPLKVGGWAPYDRLAGDAAGGEEKVAIVLEPYQSRQVGDSVLISIAALDFGKYMTHRHLKYRHTVTAANIDSPVTLSLPPDSPVFATGAYSVKAIIEHQDGTLAASPLIDLIVPQEGAGPARRPARGLD